MFSGLVTAVSSPLQVEQRAGFIRLVLKRPNTWVETGAKAKTEPKTRAGTKTGVKVENPPSPPYQGGIPLAKGDSIAVDGVCLSLVDFDEHSLSFDLAPETLKITGWTLSHIKNKSFNLEPSLNLQSALGGHLLTGHVSGQALVQSFKKEGKSYWLEVQIPKAFKNFVYPKGYVALNGVSLTVNKVRGTKVSLCLIPDTLKRTNLSQIKVGDRLNFEEDYLSVPAIAFMQKAFKKLFWLVSLIGLVLLFVMLAVWFQIILV